MEQGKLKEAVLYLPEGHVFFHEGIKLISDYGEIDDCDADWLVDAEAICQVLTEAMAEKDVVYKYMLKHLLATATFYRGSKIDFPLDFEQYLRFRMPFPVTPVFNSSQPGYINLLAPTSHPMVYPHFDRRSFCPYVPRMQGIQDERMIKYRNVLRLLLRIGTGNNIPDMSDIFVLKGLHFYRLRYNANCDCNLSLPTLFIELLGIHREITYNEALQRFVTFGGQQAHWMGDATRLYSITRNVAMFYYMNCIPVEHLKHLFGII
ncbi:uncharacterized protein [Drosophila kikkawai]|uniref:Uncharacterized protein isoform X2 n=1 Tax=Drosophila kikkawai TaxID=30033 RepID=A0ABM4GH98_DROKI